MEPLNMSRFFTDEKVPEQLAGKKRVELLKALEDITKQIFLKHESFESLRNVLGPEKRARLEAAAVDQIWTGFEEYTEEFYRVLEVCVKRQNLQRAFVRQALDTLDHGFDTLDRNLIYHASLVADLYEEFYRRFAQTVQGNSTALRLAKEDKEGKVPKDLYNHYTVILFDEASQQYSQIANASYFKEETSAILGAFDRWIADLQRCETAKQKEKEQYLQYLSAYRTALAETDVSKLESEWTEVDVKWMDIRHWVQVVHDIEYGYGDPLRCKVTPEFTIRLMDESYQKENNTIQEIQEKMVEYFQGRKSQLAQDGISETEQIQYPLVGLKKAMAGIYYLPFQQGVGLFFRFSGQSVPNRAEVRLEHGCKIYFDPVSTASREEFARKLARDVCADPARSECIDTIGTIVYHIAAHEIGHAIYSLDAVKQVIKVSTKTLLEEPRAELTALHTLLILLRTRFADEALVNKILASFMLQDLRRFVMYDSTATKPYLVSAISNWARAERLGYLKLDNSGKVVFDDSKVQAFLQECSEQFEEILNAEDKADGPGIEKVLETMQSCESAPIVNHLVTELFHNKRAQKA